MNWICFLFLISLLIKASKELCISTLIVTECKNLTFPDDKQLKIANYRKTLKLYPPLEEIPSRMFISLPTLTKLVITHGMVKTIHEDSFKGLTNLQSLDLYWNEIEFLPTNVFQYCKQLSYLNIGGNDLPAIDRDVFRNLDKLKELVIASNLLASIPNLVHLTSLEVLDASKNKIEELNAGDFKNLPNLKDLNVRWNAIKQIKQDAFYGLNSLVLLNIERNKLRTVLTKNIIENLPELKEIRLSSNNFTCATLEVVIREFNEKGVYVPESYAEPGPISYHGIFCLPV